MTSFIIDTKTKGHKLILKRLGALKSTLNITDNGQYTNCPDCSQISIETTLSEGELEHWLWKNNLDYIGVWDDN